MRTFFAAVMFLATVQASGQHNLAYFRSTFHASQDEEVLEAIIEITPEEQNKDNMEIIMAYKAVSETMLADHKFSPISKLQLFNSGKEKLEAIIADSANPEVHYLRLLVQLNVPGILNYSDQIEDDLQFLSQTLKEEDLSYDDKLMFKKTLTTVTKDEEYLGIINNIVLK